MSEFSFIVVLMAAFLGGVAICLAVQLREQKMLALKVKTIETALSAVKPALDEYPKIANEIRDIREVIDELPVDDLVAQAAYEKTYAESLEAINNYSVAVAMGGGERN